MKPWRPIALIAVPLTIVASSLSFSATTYAAPTSTVAVDTGLNPQVVANSKGNAQNSINLTGNLDVALTLNSPNQSGLDNFVQSVYTPGSANYRKYLSVQQFSAAYGQPQSMIDSLVAYFHSFGIQSTVYPGNLNIDLQGSVQNFQNAFATKFAALSYHGQDYIGTTTAPTLPSTYSGVIKAAIGLNTLSNYTTHISTQANLGQGQNHGSAPTGYMPDEVLQHYDGERLVQNGASGAGQTIGIATLAGFHPNDAYYFWNTLGLSVSSKRINEIPVDGGSAGPIGWNAGSDETTLDVEQSGALAPGANINVYEAPNTNAGFIDLFYAVAGADAVQEMSVSWGESEDFIDSAYAGAISLATEQGAAEGISMFAAAGDSGAYDGYGYTLPDGTTDTSLSVDDPADSPYITAAGGTTLPGSIQLQDATGNPFSIPIPTERVWGWDYLSQYWNQFGFSSQQAFNQAIYPVGGGGGFSQFFTEPWYQTGLTRAQSTGNDPHSGLPYSTERSMPDVSMNADPFTGYSLYVSYPGQPASGLYQGWNTFGGTSFVAPQLAGLTALMNQADGTQIGFWNAQMYNVAPPAGTGSTKRKHGTTSTTTSPFTDITAGNNWYYNGVTGYDEGTGLGTPDITALAAALK